MNEEILKEAVNFGATIVTAGINIPMEVDCFSYQNSLHYVGKLKSR